MSTHLVQCIRPPNDKPVYHDIPNHTCSCEENLGGNKVEHLAVDIPRVFSVFKDVSSHKELVIACGRTLISQISEAGDLQRWVVHKHTPSLYARTRDM